MKSSRPVQTIENQSENKNPHNDKYGYTQFGKNVSEGKMKAVSEEQIRADLENQKVYLGNENSYANNSHLG